MKEVLKGIWAFYSYLFWPRWKDSLIDRVREFMENEARSCSMNFGYVTPQYVSRMWGGTVPMDEIAVALKEAKRQLI